MKTVPFMLLLVFASIGLSEAAPGKANPLGKGRKPSQYSGYACAATPWPLRDYPADRRSAYRMFHGVHRQSIYEYFLHEISTLENKDPARLSFARYLGSYLVDSEPSKIYRGFVELLIFSSDLNTPSAHRLDFNEICAFMAKTAQLDPSPRE